MFKKSHLILIIILFILGGCEKKEVEESNRKLKIYNWEDYIGSSTLEEFEKRTGIKVEISYFEDEEKMFAEIRSNTYSYDLLVASDDLIREMIAAKVLQKLDTGKIPNIKNIDSLYMSLDFDPGNKYSVPYLWGTTGMVVNRKFINGRSWGILFNSEYSGKVAMLNNSFEVLSASLKLLGKSINPESIGDIDLAMEQLEKQRSINKGYFDAVSIKEMLLNEDLWASQIYSGEGMSVADENDELEFFIPDEGSPIWLDSFVIPKNGENIEEAYIFLDYILEGEINGKISSELWYATSNREALKYVDKEILESSYVYPSKEILKKCEYYEDVREMANYIHMKWSSLKNNDFN